MIINSDSNKDIVFKESESILEYSNSWACILYSQDDVNKAIELCRTKYLTGVISPCHDLDKNVDGVMLKAHWHFMLLFESKKSNKQMEILFKSIGGVGREHIYNIEKYYFYLWHNESTDKVIYKKDDLIFINCDENKFVNENTILNNIIDIIRDEKIIDINDLFDILTKYYLNIDSKILNVVRKNFNIINGLFKSNYNKYYSNDYDKAINNKKIKNHKVKGSK